ncbi:MULTISPECIES: hypothetical protein [unclassified Symbiopectobacterium]|uniref:hypothetical protein n=1 Tax=unclassified Symbiopectobacterium TaxID=2794573 RepID=UPI002226D140|nr:MULTISPECIES: hypothetical protein [unclassified Symbiopectobacterium]MCW2475843.1 hypothetical protein [Candidatus Symbiopectobacterium sp. NZEC151]MCW2482214.1 hypothetical protein [Candidatus Symbiopectobacterium sp. NZEC135]
MRYTEYLFSAYKHNQACRVLKEKIDQYDESKFNTEEVKFLILNLYYLSGYIIECSMKFKIFELCNYDRLTEINESGCNVRGINYRRDIKNHNFDILQNTLSSFIGDFPHMSKNKSVNILIKKWNPEIRYQNIIVDYDHVVKFYEHTVEFLKKTNKV